MSPGWLKAIWRSPAICVARTGHPCSPANSSSARTASSRNSVSARMSRSITGRLQGLGGDPIEVLADGRTDPAADQPESELELHRGRCGLARVAAGEIRRDTPQAAQLGERLVADLLPRLARGATAAH